MTVITSDREGGVAPETPAQERVKVVRRVIGDVATPLEPENVPDAEKLLDPMTEHDCALLTFQ